jgi:hypothetical protein
VVHQKSADKGVDHYGIIDVGNRLGLHGGPARADRPSMEMTPTGDIDGSIIRRQSAAGVRLAKRRHDGSTSLLDLMDDPLNVL